MLRLGAASMSSKDKQGQFIHWYQREGVDDAKRIILVYSTTTYESTNAYDLTPQTTIARCYAFSDDSRTSTTCRYVSNLI